MSRRYTHEQQQYVETWKQRLRKLKEDWKSVSKETGTTEETNRKFCFDVRWAPLEGSRKRRLTQEPTFCAPGEEPILISRIGSGPGDQSDRARKCPSYPTSAAPTADDDSTELKKYLRKEVERLEDENATLTERIAELEQENAELSGPSVQHQPPSETSLVNTFKTMLEGWKSEEVAAKDAEIAALKNDYNDLKQKNETLRIENDALQQQGQGAEERETDVGLEELRDKVLQRLEKEGKRMSTALTNISDAELKGKLQQLRDKYNQEIGSLRKKPWKANGIKEILELWDMVAQLGQQFNDEIFQFKQEQWREDWNKYRNTCGVGEKPLNHTMRALRFCDVLCDSSFEDVKDARMDSYNHWVERVCEYCEINGDQLAKQLEEKYPEYCKLVNTFADFDVRLWAMRNDLAELNLHQCEKLVDGLTREDGWLCGVKIPVRDDTFFKLGYSFMKNAPEPAPEPQVHQMTTRSPQERGKRRKPNPP